MPLWGQQDGQFTQFMYNKQYYNPAYSGVRTVPTISVLYRKQWMGFEGAPINQQAAFNTPLGERVGVGLLLQRQSQGILRTTGGMASYSYSLAKTEKLTLKFGIQGVFEQKAIDFMNKEVIIREPNDPSTRSEKTATNIGNVGAGIYLGHTHFYVGVSMPRIIETKFGSNEINKNKASQYRHLYGMVGAAIPLGSKVRLMPAGMINYVKNAPLSMDANLGLEFFKLLTIATSYRTGPKGADDSIDFLLHFLVKNRFGVGVAYDYTLSPIKDYSKGSIELLLQFDLRERTDGTGGGGDMSNPRFFF